MTAADLNPDALAELEAKLLRDLEMVRSVRALLVEHRGAAAASPMGAVAAPLSAPDQPPAAPPKPQRPMDEMLMESLLAMPETGFITDDLRQAYSKLTPFSADPGVFKAYLKQMVRQGGVEIVKVGKGRLGSTYRRTLPHPAEKENPAD